MGIFGDDDDDRLGTIDHNSIHEAMHHGLSVNEHESVHDHNKIHEAMHFGNDKVVSPFNHHPGEN